MATNLTIDEVTQNVTLVVSNERGPAGPAGPNSVTSATTSDGTATLSLAAATITGTLTSNHIHGNLAGSIYLHVRAGEALSKGDPVYVSGSHGTGAAMVPIVSRADASNAAKMPAIAIMDAAVANNGDGHAVINGTITDLNTQAYAINSTLYVANGGGMTATKPSNAQPVARVERSNQNNGAVIVGIGPRYADITNILPSAIAGTAVITTDFRLSDARNPTNPGLATTINAAIEDTLPLDADRLPMTETAASGALRRLTFANLWGWITSKIATIPSSFTAGGGWNFTSTTRPTSAGTGTPAANSLVTQGDVEARYFNPLRWMLIPTVTGWQSTASGSGTGLDQSLLSLAIRSASTSGFGSMTAFSTQLNNERATRLGSGVGLGGYGTLNFANKLKMAVRMGSFFNFDTTKQDWAIVIGSQAKNVAGIANILPSTTSSANGYVAIECVGGNVRIITQNATTPSTRSAIIDTWVSNSNHKSYFIEVAGGIVTVSDGFSGLVLGTHSGAPTSDLVGSGSPIAIATQSNATSSTISGGILIYQIAIAFE